VVASFTRKPEILWRNTTTGANSVWYMNGSLHTDTATLDTLTGPWKMVGAADFNADRKPDILWRKPCNRPEHGLVYDGATRTGTATLDNLTDLTWKMVGTADFNNDGKPISSGATPPLVRTCLVPGWGHPYGHRESYAGRRPELEDRGYR